MVEHSLADEDSASISEVFWEDVAGSPGKDGRVGSKKWFVGTELDCSPQITGTSAKVTRGCGEMN